MLLNIAMVVFAAPVVEELLYRKMLIDRIAAYGDGVSVVVVGPPPMMKFTGLELMNNGVDAEKVWMSFERKMSCAVGKCGHCRIDEVYVCLDGPVFPYTVARDLVD